MPVCGGYCTVVRVLVLCSIGCGDHMLPAVSWSSPTPMRMQPMPTTSEIISPMKSCTLTLANAPAPMYATMKRMKSDTDEQMYPGINFGVLSGRQYCGRNVGMKASVKATTLKVTLMQ